MDGDGDCAGRLRLGRIRVASGGKVTPHICEELVRAAIRAVLALLLVGASGAAGQLDAQVPAPRGGTAPPPLSADQVLSVSSVVGGRDAPNWHPDGGRISFLGSFGGPLGLWEVSATGGKPRQLIEDVSLAGVGSTASQNPLWSPSGEYVAYVSSKGGAPEIWLWSARQSRDVALTSLGGRINSMNWSPDGRRIAFAADRYGSEDIYVVAVPSGEVTRLTSHPDYEVFPSWTPDGRHVVFDRLDDRWLDHDVLAVPADGSAPPRLVVRDPDFFDYRGGTAFGYAPVSRDGGRVLFRSQRSGWLNYWTVPLAGGEPRPVAAEQAEQSEASWSPDGKSIAYVSNRNGTHALYVAGAAGGKPRALVAPDEGVVSKPAWSPDGTRISYTFATTTTPADLYVVDVASRKTTRLTNSMPSGLAGGALVAPRKVTYPSADGLTISAYLYEPRGLRPGEKAPGIMWVHGGPTSQYSDTYQAQVQYFAQRGYAVLLPNIRGSSGYGRRFEDANNGCWGHCDLKDVVAGVEYLKRQGYVNPAKMGIHGISYGGVMTMSAVVNAPGVFQAAIPESGYGDWVKFHEWNDELQHTKLLAYEFGPWPDSLAVYKRNSPIYNVKRVTTPTFIVHGQGATTPWRPGQQPVPASLDFARALDAEYKIFRYKSYPGETYYVTSRANVRQKLGDMLAFWDQFLRDGVRDAPSAAREQASIGGGGR
jgi:dipeptidyl aminopeptidase/acylaminoacyl peptidase